MDFYHYHSWADGFNHRVILFDVERSSFLLWALSQRAVKAKEKTTGRSINRTFYAP